MKKVAMTADYRTKKKGHRIRLTRSTNKFNENVAKYEHAGKHDLKGKGKGWRGDSAGHSEAAKKAWEKRKKLYGDSGRKGGKPEKAKKTNPRKAKTLGGGLAVARDNRRKTKKS